MLRGLDFVLPVGQATALIGANGSGKSTLLRCLVRLEEPSDGQVRMLGRDVLALGLRDLRRFRSEVGIVWQRHNLVPRLSALSNVIHGVQSRMSGPRVWMQALAPATVRDEAMTCLARVGLADRALMRVDALSGGQQQRVAIARMLMQRPAFILADEPDASLDPQTGEEVMGLLLGLVREEGLSLLVISHRLEHALRFSDRILGLADGRIALDLSTSRANAATLRQFFDPAEAA
ncbi:MAG: ATP-binding cassette domain-containing protein [Tabrizicola sp.]|nr:ATP-binding cassette domain-containing protein [Tabrizicola sp.]